MRQAVALLEAPKVTTSDFDMRGLYQVLGELQALNAQHPQYADGEESARLTETITHLDAAIRAYSDGTDKNVPATVQRLDEIDKWATACINQGTVMRVQALRFVGRLAEAWEAGS